MAVMSQGKEIVLVIPDLHIPFHHIDSFLFLKWIRDKYNPTEVVCLGDELDMHALSDYTHDPDGYSAGEELRRSLNEIKKLYEIFPKVKVCTSNHASRPFRRAYKHGIPRGYLKDYKDFLGAPEEWEWRDSWEIDGVQYFHGEGNSGAIAHIRAAIERCQSVVHGHIHSHAGLGYISSEKRVIFGFNVGCLIDNSAYAFAYGKSLGKKPIIGAGIIYKGVPMFIPMIQNRRGRWIKTKEGENNG